MLRRANGRRVVPHAVYGSEDRQIYYPSGYPWRCIGKVYVWDDTRRKADKLRDGSAGRD